MNTRALYITILFLALLSNSTIAQYNFFIGDDAYKMKTTARGFGGITFPSLMINQSAILGYHLKPIRPFLSINLGVGLKQWRFDDNIALIRDDNGIVDAIPHPIEEHYRKNFFDYSKSKFTLSVVRIRPEFGFTLKNKKLSMGTGPLIEVNLKAKHKRKYYTVNNTKSTTVKKGIDYYNINRYQFGWGASLGTYHLGLFTYIMVTPLFKENIGPKVYAGEVGIYWRVLRENIVMFKEKRATRLLNKNME